jgi:hypothetical protein
MTIYKTALTPKINNTNSNKELSVGNLPGGQDVSNDIPSSELSSKITKLYGEKVASKAITYMGTKGWTSTQQSSRFEKVCKHIQFMDEEYARLTDTYSEKTVKEALSKEGLFSSTGLYDKNEKFIAHLEGICAIPMKNLVPTRQIANDVRNSQPVYVERKAPVGANDTLANKK